MARRSEIGDATAFLADGKGGDLANINKDNPISPTTRGVSSWAASYDQRIEGLPDASDQSFNAEPSFTTDITHRRNLSSSTPAVLDSRVYYMVWVLLWILGLINNFGYVIVSSAAKSVAEGFDQDSLLGLVQWANVALGLIAKFLNTAFFLDYSYTKRMILNTFFMGGGMFLTAISTHVNFELAIVGISFIGTSSALGESVLLGFIKNYDPMLTGAWSSGTGGAGVLGSLTYLLLSSIWNLSNFTIFCILAPLSGIYFFAFAVLYTKFHYKKLYGQEHTPAAVRMSTAALPKVDDRNSDGFGRTSRSSSSYALLSDDPVNRPYVDGDLNLSLRVGSGDAAAAASTRQSYHSQTGGQLIDSPTFRAAPSAPSTPLVTGAGSPTPRQSKLPYRLPSPPSLPRGMMSQRLVDESNQDFTPPNVPTMILSDAPVPAPSGYATDDEDDDLRSTMARALGTNDAVDTVSLAGSPALLTDNALLAAQRRASHAIDPTMFAASSDKFANAAPTNINGNYGSLLSAALTNSGPTGADVPQMSPTLAIDDVEPKNSLNRMSESDSGLSSDDNLNIPKEPLMSKLRRVLPQVIRPATLLALVYFFEYVAAGEFASKANPHAEKSKSWWKKKSFEILSFCYQVGVLISRSSISFIKIKRIDIICAIQGVMFIIWMIQALSPFMPLGVQFGSMIFIGLLGGGMYVNVFHELALDTTIDPADKEFGINIVSFFINLGIMIAGFFGIFADKVFLPDTKDRKSH